MAQRQIDHETETEATSENLLAALDERQQQHLQMQQLREATVDRGLLKIPVKRVTTAKNSEQYAVEPDHPVLDESKLRQYYEKPLRGWTDDYDIVKLLDWYCSGSDNPYDLQLHHVYCRYNEATDEWTIVKPPGYTEPMRDEIRATARRVRRYLSERRPTRSGASMFLTMLTGLLVGGLVGMNASFLPGANPVANAQIVGLLIATVVGMALFDPPERNDGGSI